MSVATSSKRATRNALSVERDAQVWDLKVAGASFAQIARQLNMGVATVHRAFHRELNSRRVPSEQVLEYKATQLAGIDRLLMEAFSVATGKGTTDLKLKAIREAVRLFERQAKLLGLDAPVQVDAVVSVREQGPDDLAAFMRSVLDRPIEVS